jgi:kinesin family protein 5
LSSAEVFASAGERAREAVAMAEATGVKVFCRFRPFNRRETELGGDESGFLKLGETSIEINDPGGGGSSNNFEFDYIFGMNTKQEHMYEIVGKPTVVDIMDGYNGTIFAYGQTGSGKTYTMFGPSKSKLDALSGIIPRAVFRVFDALEEKTQSGAIQASVQASFLEIYCEEIRDLLNPGNTKLKLHETPTKGVWVEVRSAPIPM